jgi:hypothetical protein
MVFPGRLAGMSHDAASAEGIFQTGPHLTTSAGSAEHGAQADPLSRRRLRLCHEHRRWVRVKAAAPPRVQAPVKSSIGPPVHRFCILHPQNRRASRHASHLHAEGCAGRHQLFCAVRCRTMSVGRAAPPPPPAPEMTCAMHGCTVRMLGGHSITVPLVRVAHLEYLGYPSLLNLTGVWHCRQRWAAA